MAVSTGGEDSRTARIDVASNEVLSFQLNHRDGDAEVNVDDYDDDISELSEDPNIPLQFRFRWRTLWKYMGPGWLMSLAYLDPGNLESDLQQGAYTGLEIVWVLWWATVIGLILQELSARIGVVTGKDLAQNIRKEYPLWMTYIIYVNMELAVVASDIQEVVGSGIAFNLLTNGWMPVWVGCIITGLDTFTFLAVHYLGVRYLEALICTLISIMSVCFFVNWGETKIEVADLARGWVLPTIRSYAITQVVGTVGAVIMPHNLYLHSGLVLSRRINRNAPNRVWTAINYNFIESALALLFSFFVNLAIVATNAGNFYAESCAIEDGGPYTCLSVAAFQDSKNQGSGTACTMPITIEGSNQGMCGELGLADEGLALKHVLGESALYIWAIGLLAAGQAATMTCTYAGQVIMGGCLEIQLAPWKRVALTRAFALGPSIAVAVATIENNSLYNKVNEYLNVTQSLQLPFAMLPVLHIAAKEGIMGRFRSRSYAVVLHVFMAVLVMTVNAILVVQFCEDFSPVGIGCCIAYAFFYVLFCIRMLVTGKNGLRSMFRGNASQ